MRTGRRRDRRDPSARLRAVLALPDAPEALPALMEAVGDASAEVARAALVRVARHGGPSEARALRAHLLEVDLALVRDWAATLRALGDGEAVATAADGLAVPSTGTRMAAAMALGELGDAAAAPLTHALQDRIAGVRRCALDALAALGPGVASADVCAPLLRDRDVDVRCAAVRAVDALAADADGLTHSVRSCR